MGAQERFNELKSAAEEYFKKEKQRLEAQYSFLDAIVKKRGGDVGLQEANAEGASRILANSINDYLGKPIKPSGT
jgi:hypothetical protein